jgi:GNAT superfamily N-acetyltransferase
MIELAVTDAPTPDVRAGIVDAIETYNTAQTGMPGDFRLLVIPVWTDDGAAAGGLWGYTSIKWLYVDLLVVPEPMRNSGLGTRLMQMAEAEALRRGCVGAWLNTFSFQAKPFYEKLGYATFATWSDFLPGIDRDFLLKRFA